MRFYTKKRRIPSITIVSLIDILAILLIFFYCDNNISSKALSTSNQLARVNLSHAFSNTTAKKNIILQIQSADHVTFDDKPVALDDLAEAIEEAQETYPDCKITMQADKEAPFGDVVKVLDALQTAGIKNIPTMTKIPK